MMNIILLREEEMVSLSIILKDLKAEVEEEKQEKSQCRKEQSQLGFMMQETEDLIEEPLSTAHHSVLPEIQDLMNERERGESYVAY